MTYNKIKFVISAIQTFAVDVFSVVITTLGITLLLDILLPAKFGVLQRLVDALKVIGISGQVVAVVTVALLVLIYSRK